MYIGTCFVLHMMCPKSDHLWNCPFLAMCAIQGLSVNCIASSFSKTETSHMLLNLLLLDFLERNVSIHQSWHQFLQISPLSRLLSMVHYSVKCYYSISSFSLTYKNHSDVVYLRVELRYWKRRSAKFTYHHKKR